MNVVTVDVICSGFVCFPHLPGMQWMYDSGRTNKTHTEQTINITDNRINNFCISVHTHVQIVSEALFKKFSRTSK